jgi:hypothetical protein
MTWSPPTMQHHFPSTTLGTKCPTHDHQRTFKTQTPTGTWVPPSCYKMWTNQGRGSVVSPWCLTVCSLVPFLKFFLLLLSLDSMSLLTNAFIIVENKTSCPHWSKFILMPYPITKDRLTKEKHLNLFKFYGTWESSGGNEDPRSS